MNTNSKRPANGRRKEPLAIIGLGVRMPGDVNDPVSLWNLLVNKVDAICDIPPDRWDAGALYDPDYTKPAKINVRQGGFVREIDKFDPAFFGISPKEALRIDPQQRLLLECAYRSLEDAGIDSQALSGSRTGVFIGISSHDYGDIMSTPSERIHAGPHTQTGSAQSIAANRISYVFNLLGPSFTVDTACSSSLLATHLAARSLWSGESCLALVGGVSVICKPETQMGFSKGGFLASDARCKAFDLRADGYVRSEGAGIIVIKPLARAVADRDKIYACIIGSATNQDGHTDGISSPSVEAQKEVIRDALRDAAIDPAQVSYVEMHGTGTAAGDPVETGSVGSVIGRHKAPGEPLIIGSIKTNIGHLEPASGVAALCKLALTLKHRAVPPNLHFQTPNPKIEWEEHKLLVSTELTPLPRQRTLYGGVNSFGFGGSNVHVVLQSAPETVTEPLPSDDGSARLFTLSAKNDAALKELARRFCAFLQGPGPAIPTLRDICYSAMARRAHHDVRLALVASSKDELRGQIEAFLAGESRTGLASGRASPRAHRIGFIFSGQGPQWYAMGRELLAKEPVFRSAVEEIDRLLGPLARWSLLEEMARDESTSRIDDTDVAQPALFALQVGLARLWRAAGIRPDGVVGHSIGEVAAAHVAGALSLEDAVKVIFHRSRIQAKATGKGTMLAVGIGEAQAAREIRGHEHRLCLAAVNQPELVVLSGDSDAVDEFQRTFEERAIFNRLVKVSVPFHSHHMEPLRRELLDSLTEIRPVPHATTLYSTVIGDRIDGSACDGPYWFRNIREPVLFTKTVSSMVRDGFDTFVEIAPHPILAAGVTELLKVAQKAGSVFPSLRRSEDEQKVFLGALGGLYTRGTPLAWENLFAAAECRFVDLPAYPWQRESYWLETGESRRLRLGAPAHPLVGRGTEDARDPNRHVWEIKLDKRVDTFIEDHRVQGPIVFPGAGHVELAITVGRLSFGDRFGFLEDINFKAALFLPDEGEPSDVQLTVSGADGGYHLYTRPQGQAGAWRLCSTGRMNHLGDAFVSKPIDLSAARARCTRAVDVPVLHGKFHESGLQLGPAFRGVKRLWGGEDESFGEIHVPASIQAGFARYNLHPAVLDACFQALFGSWYPGAADSEKMGVYIPVHIDRVKFHQKPGSQIILCYGRLLSRSEEHAFGNIWIFNDREELVAEIQGFVGQYLKGSRGEYGRNRDTWFYEYRWHMKPRPEVERTRRPGEYLPTSRTTRAVLEKEAAKIRSRAINQRYHSQFEPEFDRLCLAYITECWAHLGITPAPGQAFDTDTAGKAVGVRPQHRRLFRHLTSVLAAHGPIEENDAAAARPGSPPAAVEIVQAMKTAWPEFGHELALLERCGPELRNVMLGKVDPIGLIFPERDWDVIVAFYQKALLCESYNTLMRRTVRELTRKLPPEQTLRVLEVGAGTGGLTQAVLPLFPADRTEYVFTDMSSMFLMKAQRRFAEYPFVKYRLLNVENDPVVQGFEAGSFDIVIASDVLHATRRLSKTLGHMHRVLASRGLLLMLEITKSPLFNELIFGLTEGWWCYEDTDVRRAHATLPIHGWLPVLAQAGFPEVVPATTARDENESAQTVFICRRDAAETSGPIATPPAAAGVWLVFADQKVAPKIIQGIEEKGDAVIRVTRGSGFVRSSEHETAIHPASPDDMKQLVDLAVRQRLPWKGVVHTWAVDGANPEKLGITALDDAQLAGSVVLLNLVRELAERTLPQPPQVFWVTSGVETIEPSDISVSIAQASLWGLARVMMTEHPSIPTVLVDLSARATAIEISGLIAELFSEGEKEEIAYRGRKRFIHRLDRISPADMAKKATRIVAADNVSFDLATGEQGGFDGLRFQETSRVRQLAADEIEIRTAAGGLNFRDVMVATGMLSDEAIEGGLIGRHLGLEVAGVVVRTGAAVTRLRKGDEVLGFAASGLSGYAVGKACEFVKKPAPMSWEEAAAIPVVYLTAHYALNERCRMAKGETVLVHSGAGGVGLAAIHLAHQAGAEVIASASPAKWRLLKRLGVRHIVNSRSLAFADQVREFTNGRGVDIVLNSLAGDFIYQSLRCLAPYGRFVEIGKTDIYGDTKLGLRPFGDNLSYHAVDIDRLLSQNPALAGRLLRAVVRRYVSAPFKPHPVRVFPIAEIQTALRTLAAGRTTGKVVVRMHGEKAAVSPAASAASLLRDDATYLITGGLGGFGLAVAQWLVTKGVRHLALLGRSGASRPEAQAALAEFKKQGVKASVLAADVSIESDVQRAFARLKKEGMPAVRGIIHAAMVLADTMLTQMTPDRLMEVMRPKMHGAWWLHQATLNQELDLFVLFSSLSSLIGNPGQGNYSAANSFLDAFSRYRRSLGLPATTVNWGVLGEVGFVARTEKVSDLLNHRGWKAFTLKESLWILEKMLLEAPAARLAAYLDWSELGKIFPHAQHSIRFSHLVRERAAGDGESGLAAGSRSIKAALSTAPAAERGEILQHLLRDALARVLGAAAADIDMREPITKMGLDSLMATQLRNWIHSNLDCEVTMMEIMRGPSLVELSEKLMQPLFGGNGGATAETAKWIVRHTQVTDPKVRLFCFPYMMGGASTYADWGADLLSDGIEVCAVQFPGREERRDEPCLRSMEAVVAATVRAMLPLLDRPFAIYGHSIGAAIGYQVARRLRDTAGQTPAAFFAGGWLAPYLKNPFHILERLDEALIDDPGQEPSILEHMRSLEIPESVISNQALMDELLPSIRADMLVGKGYVYLRGEPLACSLVAFAGTRDTVFTVKQVAAWRDETSGSFDLVEVDGGHLFIHEARDIILRRIAEILKPYRAPV